MSPLTDIVLVFNVSLDPVEMFMSIVKDARNRFDQEANITHDVTSLSDQIIHCIHSGIIKLPDELNFAFDGSLIEMTVTRTFDERITLDFCDLSHNQDVIRHDIIDLAIMPLLCYGLAGQLVDR